MRKLWLSVVLVLAASFTAAIISQGEISGGAFYLDYFRGGSSGGVFGFGGNDLISFYYSFQDWFDFFIFFIIFFISAKAVFEKTYGEHATAISVALALFMSVGLIIFQATRGFYLMEYVWVFAILIILLQFFVVIYRLLRKARAPNWLSILIGFFLCILVLYLILSFFDVNFSDLEIVGSWSWLIYLIIFAIIVGLGFLLIKEPKEFGRGSLDAGKFLGKGIGIGAKYAGKGAYVGGQYVGREMYSGAVDTGRGFRQTWNRFKNRRRAPQQTGGVDPTTGRPTEAREDGRAYTDPRTQPQGNTTTSGPNVAGTNVPPETQKSGMLAKIFGFDKKPGTALALTGSRRLALPPGVTLGSQQALPYQGWTPRLLAQPHVIDLAQQGFCLETDQRGDSYLTIGGVQIKTREGWPIRMHSTALLFVALNPRDGLLYVVDQNSIGPDTRLAVTEGHFTVLHPKTGQPALISAAQLSGPKNNVDGLGKYAESLVGDVATLAFYCNNINKEIKKSIFDYRNMIGNTKFEQQLNYLAGRGFTQDKILPLDSDRILPVSDEYTQISKQAQLLAGEIQKGNTDVKPIISTIGATLSALDTKIDTLNNSFIINFVQGIYSFGRDRQDIANDFKNAKNYLNKSVMDIANVIKTLSGR